MEDKTSAIIKKHFNKPPDEIEEASEGLMHKTFIFELSDRSYVLQLSKDEESTQQLKRGLKMYDLFNGIVPVPKPFKPRLDEYQGVKYTLVEKVNGKNAETNIDTEKIRQAGKILAKIHNYQTLCQYGDIKFKENTLTVEPFEQSLRQKRLEKVVEDTEALREAGLENLADEIQQFFQEHGSKIPDNFQPRICHNDYSPDNIIYKNGKINAVLDWDLAYSGCAQRDLIKAANAFWMHDPCSNQNIRKQFYDSYQQQRPLQNFEKNEPILRIETLTRLITGLEEIRGLEEQEIEVYSEKIRDNLAYARKQYDDSTTNF